MTSNYGSLAAVLLDGGWEMRSMSIGGNKCGISLRHRHPRRLSIARAQDPFAAPGGADAAAGAVNGIPNLRLQVDAPQNWPAAVPRPRPRPPPGSLTLFTRTIPLIHLDTDARQLHLHEQPARTPLARPMRLLTQLLLPLALWVITLVPEWEVVRARAIRQRERSMRVLVGEMSTAPSPVVETTPLPDIDGYAQPREEGTDNTGEFDEEASQTGDANHLSGGNDGGLGAELRRNVVRIYPPGLNAVAKRYYERVMDRGEGIDWEEEREAQRAMGIGEEEEGDRGGMRMGVL